MKRFEGVISSDFVAVTQTIPMYFELQNSLAKIIAREYKTPKVLDIGIGTGITTAAIISESPGCCVIGVDDERSMLDQAKGNLSKYIETGCATIYEADALSFIGDLEASSLDVVASSYTLHNCFASYRKELEIEIYRILKPGGMFINNDKYAADDRTAYVREICNQIVRFDILKENGREDLRKLWIEHEVEDQIPERIMWTKDSLDRLSSRGFVGVSLVERHGQYAILSAYKPLV